MTERPPRPARPLPPLLELTRARLLEFFREPGVIFWVFVFPVLLAVALGIAFRSRPPDAVPVAVVAGGGGETTLVMDALAAAEGLAPLLLDRAAAGEAVRAGEVELGAELRRGDGGGELVLTYDPDRPGADAAAMAVADAVQRALGRRDPAAVIRRPVSERGGRYIDFLLPGLIGLNLMSSSLWGVGFAVVQTRVGKLLKRFVATPMRRADYLLALVLSRGVFLIGELVALVAAGYFLFGVTVEGSWLALLAVAAAGALAFTGLALLVAARPTTVETASGMMNFVMLPMWVVSGVFFSYARFPEAVQPAIRALPLTALNDALRAVMNDGAPLAASWLEMLVLAGWGVGSFAVALRIFRWQ